MPLVELRNISKIYHLGGEEIRALVNSPKIVFADEPTGNLDSHTGEAILQLFHQLSREGRTIALVTHDPEIAAVTPRRIEIRDGKIAQNVDAQLAGTALDPKFSLPYRTGSTAHPL